MGNGGRQRQAVGAGNDGQWGLVLMVEGTGSNGQWGLVMGSGDWQRWAVGTGPGSFAKQDGLLSAGSGAGALCCRGAGNRQRPGRQDRLPVHCPCGNGPSHITGAQKCPVGANALKQRQSQV